MIYYNLYVEGTNDLYTYLDEKSEFKIGDFVSVKFRNKERIAIIIEKIQSREFEYTINSILKKYDSGIIYDEKYIKLLKWIKKYYISGYSHIFNIGMSKKEKVLLKKKYKLNENQIFETELEKKVLDYLKKKKTISASFMEKKFTQEEIEILLINEKISYQVEKVKRDTNKISTTEEILNKKNIILNEDQKLIQKEIEESNKKYFLIKGVTGSGKTEVYIALIKKALLEGKTSIFLVPEISLTPQMIKRFIEEFGNIVAILHSKITTSDISKEWKSISNGEKKIVLGVRSAIFAPLKNLGYIIIDEEHETTYKQDNNPRYNAKIVALKRAELENCKIILGSATPSIESYYYAEKNIFKLLRLNNRYNDAKMPEIKIIDMKEEENLFFSKKLLDEIKDRLLKKEQVIILLNRKGYSTYIQCKNCGHVEECPHCSVKYSFYQKENILRCNYCGISKKYTGKCSKCESINIIHSGIGVEKVQEALQNIFPTDIIRVDADISKEKNFHENMYKDFLDGKYSIMVGTQMITKGFHFPNVTLVGVINADMGMNFPDFRASEKTFQLLTQVAGRAGRGDKPGTVIIQTYQPENKIFKDIINSDYENFYKIEIEDRRILNYPPFSKMINIGISSQNETGLAEYCKNIYNIVNCNDLEIYGPMKSLVYKVKDRYRYNILIKGSREKIEELKKIISSNLKNFEKNKKIRVTVDVDPINLV